MFFGWSCPHTHTTYTTTTTYQLLTLDMQVGNEVLRGVTGLQRKLLSLAEATAGPRRVLLLDNPAAGLDAESELVYFHTLERAVQHLPLTVLVCQDQPSEAVLGLADDLMVMADGYVVYCGPPGEAVSFFEGQGFSMPADRDPVDFINMVLSPQFQPVRVAVHDDGIESVRP